MAMQTDVKVSAALTASGAFTDQAANALGRVRVKAIYIVPGASAGSVTLKDGGSGGTTLAVINTVASATQPTYMLFPGQGLLCETSVYGTLSNVGSVVVFYG
jgi:hypothetical protein